MRTILLPAQRHRKSSRGIPRLRRMPLEEQGTRALRCRQLTRILALTFHLIVRPAIAFCPIPESDRLPPHQSHPSSDIAQLVRRLILVLLSIQSDHPRIEVPAQPIMLQYLCDQPFRVLVRRQNDTAAGPPRGCSVHADRRTSCWRSE
jgi:hypothetical protein